MVSVASRPRNCGATGGGSPDDLRRLGQQPVAQPRVQRRPQVEDGVSVTGARQVDHPLLDPSGVGDQHQHQPGRGQLHQLQMADPGARQRRVLHDGDVAGQLGQRADRAVQHVVEVGRAVEERLDGPPLGVGQRLELGEPVDEEPVAGVGRDPAGAGVRLGDQALFLEHGHVVADRRRRDAQVVPIGQRLAADGLVGGDEVLDDGAQDLELAISDRHACTSSPRCASSARASPAMRGARVG